MSSPAKQVFLSGSAIMDEGDEEAWRRGDGGSSPSYRSIFLATVSAQQRLARFL